ncbi:MAG TPA: helix-turn-helix transcriptional regulator [Candidatus Bathyarchaeia archaeon]|nr:helix-turn-helix transcriptional regulator [Candidatus Bathyarchaeia archaeon]
MAYDRLVRKLTKENLWIYILRLLQEKDMYAYAIKRILKERFAVNPATITVYVVLYGMERERLITAKEAKASSERPDRKYYKITDYGRETLTSGIAFMKETLDRISS